MPGIGRAFGPATKQVPTWLAALNPQGIGALAAYEDPWDAPSILGRSEAFQYVRNGSWIWRTDKPVTGTWDWRDALSGYLHSPALDGDVLQFVRYPSSGTGSPSVYRVPLGGPITQQYQVPNCAGGVSRTPLP